MPALSAIRRARFRPFMQLDYEQTGITGSLMTGVDRAIEFDPALVTKPHAFTFDPSTAGDNVKTYTWDATTKLLLEGATAKMPDGVTTAMTKLYGFAVVLRRLAAATVPTGTITVARTDWNGVTGSRAFADEGCIQEGVILTGFTLLTSSVLTLTASASGCGLIADVAILGGTA